MSGRLIILSDSERRAPIGCINMPRFVIDEPVRDRVFSSFDKLEKMRDESATEKEEEKK